MSDLRVAAIFPQAEIPADPEETVATWAGTVEELGYDYLWFTTT
jgi:hypothetical protein